MIFGYLFLDEFLFPNNGIYAPGYTKEMFNSVKTGMDLNEVEDILELPLTVRPSCNGNWLSKRLEKITSKEHIVSFINESKSGCKNISLFRVFYSDPGPKHSNWEIKLLIIDANLKVIKIETLFEVD